jgi:hypothetical protein
VKATVKIDGLRETLRGLEGLKKSTQVGVLNRVLKKAAKPVEAAAKANAPVDSGELKESINTVVIRRNAGKSAYARTMRGGGSREDAVAAAREANAASAEAVAQLQRVLEEDRRSFASRTVRVIQDAQRRNVRL